MAGATPSQDWGSFMTTMDEDRDHLQRNGLRPRAASRHEHVQQLRHQLLDHLDPCRRYDQLLAGHGHQRSTGHHHSAGWWWGSSCCSSAWPWARSARRIRPPAGLYYWSAKLARKNAARWSWFTGYFNLLGQIGVIASVDYALSIFIAYFIRMFDDGFKLTVGSIYIIFLIVLVVHGLLNTFRINLVKIMGDISVWWHVVGVVIIAAVLFIAPSNKRGSAVPSMQRRPG